MQEVKGSLEKKLFAAFKDIDAVEKRGKNTTQKYDFVKATDVAREVRGALLKNGVGFGFNAKSYEHWTQETKSGGTMLYVMVNADFSFTDTETGESKTISGIGCGSDTGDKGIYKAFTGALKYALRLNFLIPDELDPENDRDDKQTAGVSEPRYLECMDWIANAATMPELKRYYEDAYKEAAQLRDAEAQKAYIAAKDARKKILEAA